MRNGKLTINIVLLIVLMVIIEAFADLLMKKGMMAEGVGEVGLATLSEAISSCLSSWMVWAGIVLYLATFIIWITALSKVELSVAYPVSSVNYIFVPIIAIIFLHEHVSIARWIAALLIIAGIYFISKSSGERGA